MIIFTYGGRFFCYLVNPKCGTHTFQYFLYNFMLESGLFKIFHMASEQPLNSNNELEYSNYNYYHCNLEGAINFFKIKNINLENVVFFTTIRNPFERMLSNYWYHLKFWECEKINKNLTQQEDFNEFVLTGLHHKNFEPNKFRYIKNYSINVNILCLENWNTDFKSFCEKHNFPLETTNFFEETVLNSSSRSEKLYFNKEITDYITENYYMDFVDGKYDINPNNLYFNNENNQLPRIETNSLFRIDKDLEEPIVEPSEESTLETTHESTEEPKCKYYVVTCNWYFKYTRSIESFENDSLFQCLRITYEQFIDFLKKIQYTETLTKILYCINNFEEANKIIKFSEYLSPMIKIFCINYIDWWCNPGLEISHPEFYFYNLNVFYYNRIRYIVCTDYKTLGFFLNKNLEEYKQNIISWDIHCYDNCFVNLNNNPINKILVSGCICSQGYPERFKLTNFNNVCIKERDNNVWSDEKAYSQYLNQYICCFSSSNYPYNMTTNQNEYSGLILLKTYEILGSGALLLSPLNQKNQLAKIGLIEDVNCMFVDMSDDNKIQEKIDFILNEQNRKLIDTIRKNGQNHGINNLSSKKKFEILKELIINSE